MENKSSYNKLIIVVSILIPIVVAILFTVRIEQMTPLTFLPPIYAFINGLTAVTLILAIRDIKKGNQVKHEQFMKISIVLSILFLLMYVLYHMSADSTPYGGEGTLRYLYFFILITHILLSIAVIPMVLISYVRALSEEFDRHRKIAKITYPIWLYVAVSGVVVYLMIAPYYNH